jgi:H+-transporting ATPase
MSETIEASSSVQEERCEHGLSSEEAARRLERCGPNTTADTEVPVWCVLVGELVAPVPCLLEAAIVLQLFLHEYIEASVIGLLLVFNAALGFFRRGGQKRHPRAQVAARA